MNFLCKCEVEWGWHSTEVAFTLLTQQPRVWILALPRFFFSILLSSCTVLRDQTHLVLEEGISQMQLAVKAWAKYYKNKVWWRIQKRGLGCSFHLSLCCRQENKIKLLHLLVSGGTSLNLKQTRLQKMLLSWFRWKLGRRQKNFQMWAFFPTTNDPESAAKVFCSTELFFNCYFKGTCGYSVLTEGNEPQNQGHLLESCDPSDLIFIKNMNLAPP